MSVSRNAGYLSSRGKEGPALEMATRFLVQVAGAKACSRIHDSTDNYLLGDLRVDSGATVEVKGQPIDPKKYTFNFAEVFEDTSELKKPIHAAGYSRLREILGLSTEELAQSKVRRYDIDRYQPPVETLGMMSHLSVSIASIAGSCVTLYCNTQSGWLFAYESRALLDSIRQAASSGFDRGRGLSNDVTYAVMVKPPLSGVWRESRCKWTYHGSGNAQQAVARIMEHLK